MRIDRPQGSLGPVFIVFTLIAAYLLLRAPAPDLLLESNDQGYQMALGMALATGRLPCFDVLTQYGPLVAVFSWLGFAVTGSAAGEICIDALGYAAAIALAWQSLRRQGHAILAILAAIALLALFPRFYKWYYWLLPLLGLVFAERFRRAVDTVQAPYGLLAAWGLLAGVAWLVRYDLGLQAGIFGVLAMTAAWWTAADGRHRQLRAMCRPLLWYLAMCAVLPAALLVLIALLRGREQLLLFLLSIRDGAVDSVESYGVSPFAFDLAHPVSATNLLPLQQLMFVAVYASALVIAGRELVSIHDTQRRNGFSLLCVGLTGLGVLPQALHRADLQHLLQVAPPFVLALAALAARLADRTTPHNAPLRLAGIIGCVVAVALIVAAAPHASFDLASAWRNPVRYWRTISGLPESRGDEPVADMAVAIERLTPPDANVFLLMSTSRMPLLFFAQRHQPGLFPVYEAGMFSGPTWLAHNRIALEQTPPDYLVVPEPGTTDSAGEPAPFMPDLISSWQQRYTRTLHVNARYRLLERNGLP